MTVPLVSVAIPAYNHERYIDDCLSSVCAQTYPRLELIVIDDGSTDTTATHIETFLAEHSGRFERVHFRSRANQGVSATSNECIEMARGEWVHLLGSDDLIYPNKIAAQSAAIESWSTPQLALVYADVDVVDSAGKILHTGSNGARPAPGPTERGHLDLLIKNPIPNPTVALRRGAILDAGGFDTTLKLEDWDCWLRLAVRYPIARVPQVLAAYRHHSANTHRDQQRMLLAMMQTFAKFLDSYGDSVPDNARRACLAINQKRLLRWARHGHIQLLPRLVWDRLSIPWHRPEASDFRRYASWLENTQLNTIHPS